MNIEGIDHVEMYVGDARQSAFYLRTAFGFRLAGEAGPETGVPDSRSLLLVQGGLRLVLTSALTWEHRAAEYVRAHGDGVANIAFAVTDAAGAYQTAVARGATPVEEPTEHRGGGERVVTATVGGFGDVVHRLVQRDPDGVRFLPGSMATLPRDPEESTELVDVLDHVAVCLPAGELAPTVAFYETVFGFSQIFEEMIEVGEQAMDSKVVQNSAANATFTLIEPVTSRKPGQIDEFLERHGGAGVQHLALLVDDIVTAVDTLEQRGVRFLDTPDSYYKELEDRLGRPEVAIDELRRTNVLVDQDHWGQVFQIFTQSMHVRRTFFWEVIDRHGARTFGSGNIKALYEAVAREKAEV
ncbi:4-hydroxyphenylpyruvate dioxygenase [Streptomyces sp. AJS327]|uniref:4-hydroxyphenylpyruvate dioxygenase n=1 Tax=Streptomyces sp. AJS327 TaxID=2545265 RepID=UPI0015DECC50|nr:4-hydroxyphenylpyruvate dioxygenase [Streptomyces sp. AJS327]MBA0052650.1 4-hydroxyphenylpyruvate dioxygenase [Streptomyces sp. AJS327]